MSGRSRIQIQLIHQHGSQLTTRALRKTNLKLTKAKFFPRSREWKIEVMRPSFQKWLITWHVIHYISLELSGPFIKCQIEMWKFIGKFKKKERKERKREKRFPEDSWAPTEKDAKRCRRQPRFERAPSRPALDCEPSPADRCNKSARWRREAPTACNTVSLHLASRVAVWRVTAKPSTGRHPSGTRRLATQVRITSLAENGWKALARRRKRDVERASEHAFQLFHVDYVADLWE